MSSIGCSGVAYLSNRVHRFRFDARLRLAAVSRNAVSLFAVTVTAMALGACAQSGVTNKAELHAASRRTPLVAGYTKTRSQSGNAVASFYDEGSETASGEKFDPNKLTAAHPSLPFGTKLRVTDVATGRSVTVRVNDRGPFVAGRSVDLSYSAAERLGIVDQGVAKVKLEVVRYPARPARRRRVGGAARHISINALGLAMSAIR